ncbi:hypothetical protein ACFPRL_35730 [Pseudoclavibacter helvolus]
MDERHSEVTKLGGSAARHVVLAADGDDSQLPVSSREGCTHPNRPLM